MMFRQILVDERDIDLQRIVWQPPGSETINHYELLTLTYGKSCSPFLVIRTLRKLAADEAQTFPDASKALLKNIYVDDLFVGAPDEASAFDLQEQLINILKSGNMHLKKGASNLASLLSKIPESDRLRPNWWEFKSDNSINALGILWDTSEDEFRFNPIGWLSPITFVAKILMQDLWKPQIEWDKSIPKPLFKRWSLFQSGLLNIENINFPRWVNYNPGDKN